ncbi:MAG: adenylylsulfate kinase [Eubacteriales bacterium]|nr:adenylylsulfate kinase [Eubacteriales bacterium]
MTTNVTALRAPWTRIDVPETIPHGDMPGDKICIGAEHIQKAEALFPALKEQLAEQLASNPYGRAVLCVCGGSGVGKSEIASVLAYYLNTIGVGAYIMSGDNYPRRIPRENDIERERVFRVGGLRGLVDSGRYTDDMGATLRRLWAEEADCDPSQLEAYPWLSIYQQAGRRCLDGYLGTPDETDFDEVNGLLARFKQGAEALLLKRMGRELTELWYDTVDFRKTNVLIIEWTHGNSDFLQGVDIPILLNSTPAETLAHRRARNRDGKTDSAFTTMVLALEQRKLEQQAVKARLILSKSGKLLSYQDYRRLMAQE